MREFGSLAVLLLVSFDFIPFIREQKDLRRAASFLVLGFGAVERVDAGVEDLDRREQRRDRPSGWPLTAVLAQAGLTRQEFEQLYWRHCR